MNQDPFAVLAIVVAIGGSVLTWLLADARAKGRSDIQAQKIDELSVSLEETRRTIEMLHRLIIAGDSDRKWLTEVVKELRSEISRRDNSGSFQQMPKTGGA